MKIKRKYRTLLIVLAVAAAAVSLTGITFSQLTSLSVQESIQLEQVCKAAEEAPALSELHPGEVSRREFSLRNTGKTACLLRVKLCIPQAEGRKLFEPGVFSNGAFLPLEEAAGETEEYWAREGEYISYKNRKTGDLLLPGRETPALYSAVRRTPESGLYSLPETMGSELYVTVEAVPAGTEFGGIGEGQSPQSDDF